MRQSAAALSSAGEISALQAFFEGLSTLLREGRAPTANPELMQALPGPDLQRRLTIFVSNIGRLPTTVHGRLAVALNRDQVPSKLWLIEHLCRTMHLQDSRVLVIGGWYGILPLLLECLYPSWCIRKELVDVDPAACDVATMLLDGIVRDVAIACKNASELDYAELRQDPRSIVVNTISEHMSDFGDWFKLVRPGQRVALQSNDHWGCCEHTNCVASLEEFEAQAHLSEVYFRGTLPLASFRRFMLIGVR